MNLRNIITEKKTSIVGLLIALSAMAKAFNWITEEQNGAIIAVVPDLINALVIVYLMLSKDAK